MIALRYYTSASGERPVREYIDALAGEGGAAVVAALTQIAEHGLPGMPSTWTAGQAPAAVNVRPVAGKLWELKVSAQRVFYVVLTGPVLVLLHAYKKQGQKAPPKEIRLALARMREVLEE